MAWSDAPWPHRAQTGSCAIDVYGKGGALREWAAMPREASTRCAIGPPHAGTFRLGHPFGGLVLGEEDPDHSAQAGVGRDALPGLFAANDHAPSEDLAVLDRRGDQRREGEEL